MQCIRTYSYSGASSSKDGGSTGKESGPEVASKPSASPLPKRGSKAAAAARLASKLVLEKETPSGGHEAETSTSEAEYASRAESSPREDGTVPAE